MVEQEQAHVHDWRHLFTSQIACVAVLILVLTLMGIVAPLDGIVAITVLLVATFIVVWKEGR